MPERPRLGRRPPTPTIEEFEEALAINEQELQIACRNQPVMFHHVAKALVTARAEYRDAQTHLKRTEAEVALNLRQQADVAEERMTEKKCDELVTTNQEVVHADDAVNERYQRLEELLALKESYVQRKDMLRELVALFIADYYSDPTRGSESRMRDIAVEGVRRARRLQQQEDQDG